MSSLFLSLVSGAIRAWTLLYSAGLPPIVRDRRRAEVESDLWELSHDSALSNPTMQASLRLLLGVADDLQWRLEQVDFEDNLALRRTLSMTTCVAVIGSVLWIAGPPQGNLTAAGRARVDDCVGRLDRPKSTEAFRLQVVTCAGAYFGAQTSNKSFDVVSIKSNRTGPLWDAAERPPYQPGGRFMVTFTDFRWVIRNAFRQRIETTGTWLDVPVEGGPAWLDRDRYDVVAKADGEPSVDDMRLMLRTMFADRLKLVIHRDQRETPIYGLTFARQDRRLGLGIRPSMGGCVQRIPGPVGASLPPSGSTGGSTTRPCGLVSASRGVLKARDITLAGLAGTGLPGMVGRRVEDRTGLAGNFDIDLTYAPDPNAATDLPSVFTALQEQLGLRLVNERAMDDVIVIDSVQRPRLSSQAPPSPPGQAAPDPNVPIYFEVASIKPSESGAQGGGFRRSPGGRVSLTNVPLRQLISLAYQTTPTTLVGGPGWIAQARYDIVAKLEGDPPPVPPSAGPDHVTLALRTLLADRFKLRVHREIRELDVYALVIAKADGTLGRALKKSTQDCSPEAMRARMAGGGPQPGPTSGGPTCGMFTNPGRMMVGGLPLTVVIGPLGNMAGRNVVDKTGLTGLWDFEMTYAAEAGRGQPPPDAPILPPADPDAPSIFTALQEQLGLKLESAKAPIEVVVIDSVAEVVPD